MIGRFATGPAVIMPARVAVILHRALGVESVRLDLRGQDEELDGVLMSWCELASLERMKVLGGSVVGTSLGDPVPPAACLVEFNAKEVARMVGISSRTVRKAASRGTLVGSFDGRWSFASEDVAVYVARRNHAE